MRKIIYSSNNREFSIIEDRAFIAPLVGMAIKAGVTNTIGGIKTGLKSSFIPRSGLNPSAPTAMNRATSIAKQSAINTVTQTALGGASMAFNKFVGGKISPKPNPLDLRTQNNKAGKAARALSQQRQANKPLQVAVNANGGNQRQQLMKEWALANKMGNKMTMNQYFESRGFRAYSKLK